MKKSCLVLPIFFVVFSIFGIKNVSALYTIDTGVVVSCLSDSGLPDQSKCDQDGPVGSKCEVLDSTETEDTKIALCMRPDKGIIYCRSDMDCHELSKPTCVEKIGSYATIEAYLKNNNGELDETSVGVCAAIGGNAEQNAFSQAICNFMNIVTGNAGRAVVGVVVIVLGIMFFLGKVSWSLVLAVALGAGAMFGAPAIVGVITGKQFTCR